MSMKIVRFSIGGHAHYGVIEGNIVRQLNGTPFTHISPSNISFILGKVKLLAPCQPSKIVAIGINYKSHATEFKHDLPDSPLMFLKPATAVIGPEDNIIYPALSPTGGFRG